MMLLHFASSVPHHGDRGRASSGWSWKHSLIIASGIVGIAVGFIGGYAIARGL